MTPTLIIDRTFKGVGRIKIRTGTRLPAVRRKFSRMLTALADEGRVDMLRALRDGRIHIMQLHDAYQRKALDQLPSAETSRPLAPAMRDWIALFGETKHAASLETSLGYLESARPNALISDLPHLLLTLRVTLGQSHPRSFNMLRSAASGFIRQTLTRSHSLYPQVLAVELVPVKKTRRHRPLTVAEMRAWFPNPQIDDLDAIAWGMATTGMGCGEYWGRWSVMLDRVHIEGTKSEHYVRDTRVRDVPLVLAPAVPRMHRRTFEDKLRDRTGRAMTPYDLRRTYSNWMEAAGILRTRRKLYLGHSAGDVTGGYELHEVSAFLAEDGKILRQFAGLEHAPSIRLEARNA